MPDEGSAVVQRPYCSVTVLNTDTSTSKTLTGVLDIRISQARNEPLKWSVLLCNDDRAYTTGAGGTFDGWVRPLEKYRWAITLQSGAETQTYTYLHPLETVWSSDPAGGYVVQVSGTDHSWALLKENQSHDSWVSVAGDIKTIAGVISDVCTDQGVTVDTTGLTARNVPKVEMLGEIPLDTIKDLLAPWWGEWYFTGDTLYCRDEVFAPAGPATWTLNESDTIERLSFTESRAGIVTAVTIRTSGDSSGLPIQDEGVTVGAHTVDASAEFPNGFLAPTLWYDTTNGTIENIYTWDGAGGTGNSAAWPYGLPGGAAIKSVSFTFQQKGGLTENEALGLHYKLEMGGVDADIDALFDDTYSVTKTNSTIETLLGRSQPAKEPVVNAFVANSTDAATAAELYLAEAARKLASVTGRIGLYVTMRPGDTLYIREYGTGLGGYYYLESVTLGMAEAYCDILATQYRTGDVYA